MKLKKSTLNKLVNTSTKLRDSYEKAPEGKRTRNWAAKMAAVCSEVKGELEDFATAD